MSQNSTLEENELDLRELIATLWSHKFFISLVTGLSIFYAGYNALTTQKKFTASAIFQIENKNTSSGFNMSGELSTLASLAGFSSGSLGSDADMLIERAMGREFIINVKEKFLIENDRYFNSYNPNAKDPLWKKTIKQIIGWQKTELDKTAIIESNIVSNFRANVNFEIMDSGSINLSVTHIDPEKASNYANVFMEEVRRLVQNESDMAQKLRLNYLSETLADALQEMEKAQKNLKNYALKNSALAQENFISDSLKLDQIRMEKRKVSEISDLLTVIESFIKSSNFDNESYESLRISHPLIDDIDFRRILGMSETISAWTWPDIETIDAVSATLRDRIKRLDVEIKNIEENARIYATSAEDLAKLTRNAKISEATYTVLIEQVKSQSLAAGFQPETFKVFEYATPPLAPSSPNRNMILALGGLVGIAIGCSLSLINALRRGVYYSRSGLVSAISADLALRSKSIKRLSRKSLSDIISFNLKRSVTALDEAVVKISNKKIVYVLNSGGQPNASNTARLLAAGSAQSGRSVLICDTTGHSEKEIVSNTTTQKTKLHVESIGDNISIFIGTNGASFFTSKNFNNTINDLTKRFDQIFICANNINAQLGQIALVEFVPCLVVISGLRKTRKSDIKKIKTRQPIDLLFYD